MSKIEVKKPKSCKLTHKWATTKQYINWKKSEHYPFDEYIDEVIDVERICVDCQLVHRRYEYHPEDGWRVGEKDDSKYKRDGRIYRQVMSFDEVLAGGAVEVINYCPNCGASIDKCTCGCDIKSLNLPTKNRKAVKTSRERAFKVPFNRVCFGFTSWSPQLVWFLWWGILLSDFGTFLGWDIIGLGHLMGLIIAILWSMVAGKVKW